MASRVRIVAGHPLVSRYLVQVLSSKSELRSLLDYTSALDTDPLSPGTDASLFVVDTHSISGEIGALTRLLKIRCPGSKFLALVTRPRFSDENVLRLLHIGFEGVVKISDALEEELPSAATSLLEGKLWAPPALVAKYVRQANFLHHDEWLYSPVLTAREAQILQLIIRHLSNKEVASMLHISERTVKFHVSNIFAKLGVEDRCGLFSTIEATRTQTL